MTRAPVIAIAMALVSGVVAFVVATHFTKADSALPPGTAMKVNASLSSVARIRRACLPA
jgi:hypothetical protein